MLPTPTSRQRAGAGVERHLMRRAEEQILVGPEDVLRAVAVVDVEVDDGDALGAVLFAGVEAGDGDVREDAKAHGAGALGVMAAGADLAEGVRGAAGDDLVDGMQAGADGAECCFPGARREDRIGIEAHGFLARSRARVLDHVEIGLRVRQRNCTFDIVAQRCLDTYEVVEQVVAKHLVDGAHAIGALGMAGAGVVVDEAGVGDQEGGHRRADALGMAAEGLASTRTVGGLEVRERA